VGREATGGECDLPRCADVELPEELYELSTVDKVKTTY
jgi:hypothetical protein